MSNVNVRAVNTINDLVNHYRPVDKMILKVLGRQSLLDGHLDDYMYIEGDNQAENGVNIIRHKNNGGNWVALSAASQSLFTKHPTVPSPTTTILWKSTQNLYYALVKKKTEGGVLLAFSNNQTTTPESLATVTNEETRFRLSKVLNFVYACIYKNTPSESLGNVITESVSTGTVFANIIPSNTSGSGIRNGVISTLSFKYVDQNGNYLQYQCRSQKGKITLALYSGTTAVSSAIVSVNGVEYEITPTANASNTIKLYEFSCHPLSDADTHTVRITHNGSNGAGLRVIGVNYYELDSWNGADYDSFAYFRSSNYADYLSNPSANDAVIKQWNANTQNEIYGCSYHGGEREIVSEFFDGNRPINIDGEFGFLLAKNLNIKSSCKVTWPNGDYATIKSKWSAHEGAVSLECLMEGSVTTRELYTHMFGLDISFSKVIYPIGIDLSQATNKARVPLSRTSKVIVENPNTKQRFSSEMTLHQQEQNKYGGAWFWHVNGTYNKLYCAKNLGGKLKLNSMAFTSVHSFD